MVDADALSAMLAMFVALKRSFRGSLANAVDLPDTNHPLLALFCNDFIIVIINSKHVSQTTGAMSRSVTYQSRSCAPGRRSRRCVF